jgi:hypothetical protein
VRHGLLYKRSNRCICDKDENLRMMWSFIVVIDPDQKTTKDQRHNLPSQTKEFSQITMEKDRYAPWEEVQHFSSCGCLWSRSNVAVPSSGCSGILQMSCPQTLQHNIPKTTEQPTQEKMNSQHNMKSGNVIDQNP